MAVKSQAAGRDAEAGTGDSEAAGLARFWADVCGRTVGPAAPDRGGQRDAARMDDRGGNVEEPGSPARSRASMASAAKRIWRAGAVGHQRARLAGRTGAGAI